MDRPTGYWRVLISSLITAAALFAASAQFHPEKVQEVPISMTVVSGNALEQMTNLADVDAAAPNVILRDGGGSFGKVMQSHTRYVGQSDYSFTEEPGVRFWASPVRHGSGPPR